MADEATTEGGAGQATQDSAQATVTQTQDDGYRVPEGHRLVPEAEWNKAQRYREQLSGNQPMLDAIAKAGFKSPEDISQIAAIRDRGVDYDGLMRSLSQAPSGGDTGDEPKYLTAEDLDNRLKEFSTRSGAEFEHKSASAKQGEMMQALINELAGDSANDFDKGDWALRVQGYMAGNQLFYDEGHPLAQSEYRPYGESDFQKVRDHFKSVAEQREAAKTAEVAEAASNAGKKPAPTVAGNAGGQGKAKDEDAMDPESEMQSLREQANQVVQRRRAKGSPAAS